MTEQEKIKTFELELSYIKNPDIKNFTEQMIGRLPDYFFKVSASSSGKYHPKFATEPEGLVFHTKAATRWAIEGFRNTTYTGKFSEESKDICISSLLLHDGNKYGDENEYISQGEKHTTFTHPLDMVTFIQNQIDLCALISKDILMKIEGCIASHMGEWRTSKYSSIVLPLPQTGIEKYVHICDYYASRKCLEFNFSASLSN